MESRSHVTTTSIGVRLLAGAALAVALCGGAGAFTNIVEVSLDPPGGLSPTQTPQIVVLTFDDAMTTTRYALVQNLFTSHTNPNGCGIQATFFVKSDRTDYYSVNLLYSQGHEIAVHTINHTNGPSLAQWRREIVGSRKYLADYAQIPIGDIVGFRAPYLQHADESFNVIHERGFLYDSSIKEQVGALSPAVSNMIWPYTLDTGTPQTVTSGTPPAQPYPGLFEIPLWGLHDTNGSLVASMDPWELDEPLETLKYNFTQHYEGNRAPMGVFLHAQRFETNSANLDIADEFIAWALAHNDVWFVTMSDLVAFMCDPQDIDDAYSFEPFLCPELSPFDTNEVNYCRYPPRSGFRVCGPCPPDYPSVDNVYYQLSPMSGGAVDVITVEDKTNSFYADMVVTNNSPITSFHWRVTFTVDGGEVTSLWGAEYDVEDDIVYVEPRPDAPPLAPGETHVFGLRVGKDVAFGEVSFPMVEIVMYDLSPARPVLNLKTAGSSIDISWEEMGFEYIVEWKSNLTASSWDNVSGELYSTNWVFLPAGNEHGFFRLQNSH